MKKREVVLVINEINGLKNPLYTATGNIFADDVKLELWVNGKRKDVDFNEKYGGFHIEYKLNKFDKFVELYQISNGEKKLLTCKKNNLLNRILAKIKSYLIIVKWLIKRFLLFMLKGLKIIRNFFIYIGKTVVFAWRKYHFLIPINRIIPYMKIFFKRLPNCLIDSPYYFPFSIKHYNKWLKKQPETVYKSLEYNPLISIIIPVYNIDSDLLSDCLNSVLNQHYTNFEVCIADDCSTNQETIETLKKYEKLDSRVKVVYREKNGHISEASNSAIGIAKGEYIAFLDDDDILTEDALYLVAEALNKDRTIDMIYTDEDKMELNGKLSEPFFKPDFSPDTLLSFNYITHFAVYRTSLSKKIGLLRSEYNGAQDFDFVLRYTEVAKNIYHLPKITYHWRKVEGSTALKMSSKEYALEAGKRAIEDALKRRNIKGKVKIPAPMAHYIVEYEYESEPLISILIPTRDYASTLEVCLRSIYEKTEYKNYEILVLDNQSREEETFQLFEKYSKHENFRVVKADMEFNYAKINNLGVKSAKGDYVVLLNNDTEVISPKWLTYMVGYAMQQHVGAVGVKLLYPDYTIQHCGIVLGIAHIAGHFGVGTPGDDNGPYARYMVPYDNGAVTAACLMVSKQKYLEVGGLDEEFAVAFNDVEFNIRLLKKGYYNVCLPHVKLYHYESKSRGNDKTGEKRKRFLKECKLLRTKGERYIECDPFYNPNLSIYYPMMLPLEKEK